LLADQTQIERLTRLFATWFNISSYLDALMCKFVFSYSFKFSIFFEIIEISILSLSLQILITIIR